MSYTRKTRCAVACCPHCSWLLVFFGIDREQLRSRAVVESVLHAATHAVPARKRARKGN
jgi:hypothetical protein